MEFGWKVKVTSLEMWVREIMDKKLIQRIAVNIRPRRVTGKQQ